MQILSVFYNPPHSKCKFCHFFRNTSRGKWMNGKTPYFLPLAVVIYKKPVWAFRIFPYITRIITTTQANLMPTLIGPHYTAVRRGTVTHFQFLYHFAESHTARLRVTVDMIRCLGWVLWRKVWVINMRWWRVKGKSRDGISLFFEIAKGTARLHVPIWRRIAINST